MPRVKTSILFNVPAVAKVKLSVVGLLAEPMLTPPNAPIGGGRGGTVFTVSANVIDELTVPETPVTLTVAGPTVAELLALSVSVLLPDVELGLNDAVTPGGSCDADRLTFPEKPPASVTEIVTAPESPCETDKVPGVVESQKPGPTGPAKALMRG